MVFPAMFSAPEKGSDEWQKDYGLLTPIRNKCASERQAPQRTAITTRQKFGSGLIYIGSMVRLRLSQSCWISSSEG
jgi:hypothetical protein